jgi:hypothetical protein
VALSRVRGFRFGGDGSRGSGAGERLLRRCGRTRLLRSSSSFRIPSSACSRASRPSAGSSPGRENLPDLRLQPFSLPGIDGNGEQGHCRRPELPVLVEPVDHRPGEPVHRGLSSLRQPGNQGSIEHLEGGQGGVEAGEGGEELREPFLHHPPVRLPTVDDHVDGGEAWRPGQERPQAVEHGARQVDISILVTLLTEGPAESTGHLPRYQRRDLGPDVLSEERSQPVEDRGQVPGVLAATYQGIIDRTCEVPAGKALFMPLSTFVSFAPEFPAAGDPCGQLATPLEQVRCDVNDDIPVAPDVSFAITLDGQPIGDLFAYRAQSPPGGFTLRVPEPSFLTDLGLDPGDRFPAVADGYFLFLKPLKPGVHTLTWRRFKADQSVLGVNYTLIIGHGDDD